MAITVNIYYTGNRGAARKFAEEMTVSGVVDAIRAEAGNLRYAYFFPMEDPETVLLIDSWRDQQALDTHHASPMMAQIARLREQYDLHMRVERYLSDETPTTSQDEAFIRRYRSTRMCRSYCSRSRAICAIMGEAWWVSSPLRISGQLRGCPCNRY